MNFFKSVFSDDPSPQTTPPHSPNSQTTPPSPSPSPPSPWSFGSTLFQTLATKSESVLQTYTRDLVDFSSSLHLETNTIRQAASRAVNDLPSRLESGAAVAQSSLESVGQAIDDLTDVIVTRGKDSMSIFDSGDGYDDDDDDDGDAVGFLGKPYSRIEAVMRSMQCDLKTYCDEPEDLEEFREWREGVVVDEKRGEIEELFEGNGVMREIYDEVVPVRVDHESFWLRYFYRVYRMERAEEARLRLVKRAIEDEEEDLSWDVEDEDEGEGTSGGFKTMDELKKEVEESADKVEGLRVGDDEKGVVGERDETGNVDDTRSDDGIAEKGRTGDVESTSDKKIEENVNKVEDARGGDDEKGVVEEKDEMGSDVVEEKGGTDDVDSTNDKISKFDEKGGSEGKNDSSDFSVVSSQPSHEEDLGWDDIGDIGSDNENKVAGRISPNRADLRKRLTAAEDDEDLTWDIEDDD